MSGWRQKCRHVTGLPPCIYVACEAHIYDMAPHGGGQPAAEVSGHWEAETAGAAVASPKTAVYMTGACQLLFRRPGVCGNWLACNCLQEKRRRLCHGAMVTGDWLPRTSHRGPCNA